ncbi:hypothetical protein ACPA9J_00105 [Pseudomonas aeruginosa]
MMFRRCSVAGHSGAGKDSLLDACTRLHRPAALREAAYRPAVTEGAKRRPASVTGRCSEVRACGVRLCPNENRSPTRRYHTVRARRQPILLWTPKIAAAGAAVDRRQRQPGRGRQAPQAKGIDLALFEDGPCSVQVLLSRTTPARHAAPGRLTGENTAAKANGV